MRTWLLIVACAGIGCAQPALLTCPAEEVPCADGCADLSRSNEDCGVCGHPCDPGTTCLGGACMPEQTGVCAINNGGCSLQAACFDVGGVARCECMPGFTGDGHACEACLVCDQFSYASVPCGPSNQTVCSACTPVCETNMYEAQPCGPFTDRICATCTSCGTNSFEVTPCGPFNDRTCATCSTCATDQYQVAPCDVSNDTMCAPCDVGCATCDGPGASCSSCLLGFSLEFGMCVPSCGNGTVDSGEACDDGNHVDGDGCDAFCAVEAGTYCYGNGPSRCIAGSCITEPATALPLGGAFALDGAGTASAAGLLLTQRSTIHTTADVVYPILVEADVTYSAPDVTFVGARGSGLRDSGAADEPDNSLRARLSAATVQLAAGDVVTDSIPTPFTVAFGVRYHIRFVDDGSTATVEWFDTSNPSNGVVFATGSTFHGSGDKAFVGGGDMGGATFANIRVCTAPLLPVTNGLVARYSAMRSWTASPDPMGFISTWQDTSGGGHNLDVNGVRPVYQGGLVNTHGGIDFNGGARLTTLPFPLTTDVTVFAVMVPGAPQQFGAIAHHGDRDFDWSMEQSGGATDEMHWQTNNDNANVKLTLTQGQSYILAGRFNGTLRYFSASTFDGAPPSEDFIDDGSHSITTGSKPMYVGTSDIAEASNASIADIVYYNRALSDSERDQVIDYLRRLWRP